DSSPEAPQSLIEWPANMENGGIIFEQGTDSPGVRASDHVAPGNSPTAPSVDRDSGVADVIVYLDYRCPYCMQFEEANGAFLEAALASGAATVQVVPLTFLDRIDPTAYSSRAAGAMACLADSQPDAAWRAHAALLSESWQPSESEAAPDTDALI